MALRARPLHSNVATPEEQLQRILRKLALLLCVIVLVLVLGSTLYARIENIPFVDSLYNVVMVMTAIGGDPPRTVGGKCFMMVVALLSVAMLVTVLTQIGQLVLRREFLSVIHDWRSRGMKDHTIVCGTSHTSFELLNRLPHDKVVILVKTQEEAHRIQREHPGIVVHACDFTTSKALVHAGIEHAAMIIAGSEHDAENAFTCLSAKKLNKKAKVIARMSRTENREKLQDVGADAIISPAELAADAVMSKIQEFEMGE